MKNSIIYGLVIVLALSASCQQSGKKVKLVTNIDSVSYAIGVLVGSNNLKQLETAPGGEEINKEAMAAALPKLKAETAIGTVDFSTGPMHNCAVSGLAGGQWNKASEGPFQFQLDLVSNADFPGVALTSEFKPLAFG